MESIIDPIIPATLRGDPTKLRQVLLNLLGNAVKFTEVGGIVTRVRFIRKREKRVCIRFEIEDMGIGLSQKAQENLFHPFIQADNSTTRKYGGTGLGLSISKKLVNLMGGEIGVESAEGQGALFYFTIPFIVSEVQGVPLAVNVDFHESKTASVSAEKILSLRILLVEDNQANQKLASLILKKIGHVITIANNGKEAVEAVEKGNYDMVLMDCQMPEMDGFEATIAIREAEKLGNAHIPIIAMTANALVGDREHCLEVGMNDYISKPINPKQLKSVLEKWSNERL